MVVHLEDFCLIETVQIVLDLAKACHLLTPCVNMNFFSLSWDQDEFKQIFSQEEVQNHKTDLWRNFDLVATCNVSQGPVLASVLLNMLECGSIALVEWKQIWSQWWTLYLIDVT